MKKVWLIYNGAYDSFSVVTMEKRLRADVNNDKRVDTQDVAAIINAVING